MNVRILGASLVPASARRTALFERAVLAGLGVLGRKRGETTLRFVTDAEIRRINKAHLAHDYATDVISFPLQADPGWPSPDAEDLPFGDIVVSVPRARAQAAELGHGLLEELLTLCAHGALHLAGYDDHAPADKARMFKKQTAVVRALLKKQPLTRR